MQVVIYIQTLQSIDLIRNMRLDYKTQGYYLHIVHTNLLAWNILSSKERTLLYRASWTTEDIKNTIKGMPYNT